VILFDRRGCGRSDPLEEREVPDARQLAADALAVLDAAGSTRAFACGWLSGGAAALVLAAEEPDRIAGVLAAQTSAQPMFGTSQEAEDLIDLAQWGTRVDFFDHVAPSAHRDAVFADWYVRTGPQGASPNVARRFFRAFLNQDITDVLADVRAPVVVMHGRTATLPGLAAARHLADLLPQAELAVIERADSLPFVGDNDAIRDHIEQLVSGGGQLLGSSRQLMTILFTDIVDSTSRVAALGDRKWREAADLHDAATLRLAERFGGRIVKNTGDGQLAVFESPSAATACAERLVLELAGLGLPIRAGLHLGEVETRHGDVSGIGVNIASRVCSRAGANEILVTDSVRLATLGSRHDFEVVGAHELRGVEGRWTLARLRPDRRC
jgi:class 3 adenylate cyclase